MFRIRSVFRKMVPEMRTYCSVTRICWNCHTSLNASNNLTFFCPSCGSIQEVNKNLDYFNLLGLQKTHNLDSNELTKQFRHMQSQVHPDKFSSRTRNEQSLSLEWSSLINKAYKTLLTPLERGEYLMKQLGIELPADNSSLDKEFLMEMMERNEEVEDAESKTDLLKLLDQLRDEMIQLSNEFGSYLDSKDFKSATDNLVKMKYLTSIEKKIKEKLVKHI